jgi:hypothetical protein
MTQRDIHAQAAMLLILGCNTLAHHSWSFRLKNVQCAFDASSRCRHDPLVTCVVDNRETSDGQHDQHDDPVSSGDTA